MNSNLDWYKKPENISNARKIVEALGLSNLEGFNWGAFDYDGNFFAYRDKPVLSTATTPKWWKSLNATAAHIINLSTPIDDWKDTLISLKELKEFVEQTDSDSAECTEETASDSPELHVHLRKKLVLEIKEFSDGQCKYLVKESFGILEDNTSGCPLGEEAVGYIWTADSKKELIDDVQKLFTEQRDTLKWGEECKVSEDKEMWTTRMFVGKHPIYEGYIVVHDLGLTDQPEYWRYARPTAKKVEPITDGTIYIWEESYGQVR